MGQNLPRPGNDCRCCRSPRSSRHHLRDERRKLPPPCRARTKARSRPPARPRDNRGQCLIVARRQYKSSIPLARQSRHGNHANVATPDSHPDCRVFPSRSPRYTHPRPAPVSAFDRMIWTFICTTYGSGLPPSSDKASVPRTHTGLWVCTMRNSYKSVNCVTLGAGVRQLS